MKNELENKETIQNEMKSTEITQIDSIRWPNKRKRQWQKWRKKRKKNKWKLSIWNGLEHLSELMPNKFCSKSCHINFQSEMEFMSLNLTQIINPREMKMFVFCDIQTAAINYDLMNGNKKCGKISTIRNESWEFRIILWVTLNTPENLRR